MTLAQNWHKTPISWWHSPFKFPAVEANTSLFVYQKPYWSTVYEKICEALTKDLTVREVSTAPVMLEDLGKGATFPYSFLDFSTNVAMHSETNADYVLAVTHSLWHHASIGQLSQVPE